MAKNETVLIRCLARGSRDGWEAICLDYDIAVQGDTFDEVYRLLKESVHSYLEYACTLPKAEAITLLNRRAPMRIWVEYMWISFKNSFGSHTGNGTQQSANFAIPCAA